jgi:YVTN family beta-propeller protein
MRNVDLGLDPIGVAVSSDGSEVYVTNHQDDNLIVIETENYTITHTIYVGDEPYAMGDFLYEGR